MQKQYALMIVGCLCSFFSYAQIKKGTITGSLKFGDLESFSIKNSNTHTNNYMNFAPGVGYFIKDNLEIGVSFNYNLFRYKINGITGPYTQRSNTFGINTYSNYYIGKGKLKPYVTLQTGWQNTSGSYTSSGVKTDFNSNRFYIGGGIGINYGISKKVSLFTEATYQRTSPFKSYGSGNLNLGAGIRIFFNQKKK